MANWPATKKKGNCEQIMNKMIFLLLLLFAAFQFILIVIVNYLIDKKMERIIEKLRAIYDKIGIENPKEPKIVVTDTDFVVYKCPNCDRLINRYDKHCSRCGQRFNDNWFDKYEKGDVVAYACKKD